MRRLHVIENFDRMGGEVYFREEKFLHDPELREAYECGYKHGRKEAYKELMEEQYGERRDWREMPPAYREHPHSPIIDDDVEYRRRRRANGRFY